MTSLVVLLGFVLCLTRYQAYLADRQYSFRSAREFLNKTPCSFGLGAVLIIVFAITNFLERFNPHILTILGIYKPFLYAHGHYWQIFTNAYIHVDVSHLIQNLGLLLIVSPYEQRVGAKRYLMVFLFSAITASLLILPTLDPKSLSLGASSSLYGLAVGYFCDKRIASLRETIAFIILAFVLTLTLVAALYGDERTTIEHWGHLFGAAAGGTYCIVNKRRKLVSRTE